jgi:hypothetical protein
MGNEFFEIYPGIGNMGAFRILAYRSTLNKCLRPLYDKFLTIYFDLAIGLLSKNGGSKLTRYRIFEARVTAV